MHAPHQGGHAETDRGLINRCVHGEFLIDFPALAEGGPKAA
jgi:hypothetical protein